MSVPPWNQPLGPLGWLWFLKVQPFAIRPAGPSPAGGPTESKVSTKLACGDRAESEEASRHGTRADKRRISRLRGSNVAGTVKGPPHVGNWRSPGCPQAAP